MRIIVALLFILAIPAQAQSEADYVNAHCKGQIEVVLADSTRVDCLTNKVAWEYDFGRKWAESVGQALHYGLMTGKQPGIVLIILSETDCRYKRRLEAIQAAYPLGLLVESIGECK